MKFQRTLRVLSRSYQKSCIINGGGHSHGPLMPPFARQAPPTSSIPNEVELVWDDQVAPETCIDFDAPNVSGSQAILSLVGMFGGLLGLFGLIYLSDPAGRSPVAPRSTVIPFNGLKRELTGSDDENESTEDE